MKSEKNITINNNTIEKKNNIKKLNTEMLIASSSFFGSIIAISYRPLAIEPNMLTIPRNNANNPKSSGEYKRVKIGEIKIGIDCATVVPVININTFRLNSEPDNLILNFLRIFFIIKIFFLI